MGLRNSPLTFSRLKALALQGLVNDQVYFDILDCSPLIRDHEAHLRVRQITRPNASSSGLAWSCSHSISAAGIAPKEAKVKAVSMFPTPTVVTQARSFLGLAGFYRPLTKDYGRVDTLLMYLLKNYVPWHWDEEQLNAFTMLKNYLFYAPILAFSRFDFPFILHR